MIQQPVPPRETSSTATSGTLSSETRLFLCVVLLAAATAVALRPQPVVIGISLGVFAAFLVFVAFRALRRASQKIDRILAGDPTATDTRTRPHPLRKTA